jgi:hypothetical protein
MPWVPLEGDRYPTLGRTVITWMQERLVVPDGPLAGEPLFLTPEQIRFVMRLYRVDEQWAGPVIVGAKLSNARVIHRAILSRGKGWGKSPLLAALAITEACGPVLMDGWDADGQPVGRRWDSLGFRAKTQVIATSEDQTANTWEPLLDMVRNERFLDSEDGEGVDPMDTFVKLPRGRIEFTTSSATSREGGRPVFAVLDQTESWTPTNGGRKLAASVRRNLTKVQGCSVETPNAYRPGDESVAEKSFEAAALQDKGRTRGHGIYLDHREAPGDTDPEDPTSLRAGLAYAYGDSADVNGGWIDLDRVMSDYWDPATEPEDARMYFLNQVTHAATAWLSQPEWSACYDPDGLAPDGDDVVLGFDGSRKRARGVVDATALIGVHVASGYVFEVGVWEQPEGEKGVGWEVPRPEVHAAVRDAFARWRVVGFFADPAKWETEVAGWEALYGRRLLVKSSLTHPIEWWMTGGRTGLIVKAVEANETAIGDRSLTHDGGYALTRHALNARRRETPSGITIAKEHPDSRRKIDAAVAMNLAWWCRVQALAKGLGAPRGRRRSYGF